MAADAQSKSHLDRWWPKLAGVDVASMASRHSWNLNGIRRSAIRKMNIQRAQGNRNHKNSQCLWSLQLPPFAAASETGKRQCLTSLSEPTRKLAFEACSCQLWRPLPKQENTMACRSQRRFRGPGCQCLTSLSERTRKLAFEACSCQLWRPLPKQENTMACRSQRRFRGPGASA